MLELDKVSKSYGKVKALDKVSLKIEDGEFFGLLGPNGAGKTTLINILSLLIAPDSGNVNIKNQSRGKISKMNIGLVPQDIALYDELTALQNIHFWGRAYKVHRKELKDRARNLLAMTGLSNRANTSVASFSGGMKRRLNIACAFIHKPQFIILDEPTVGVDPQSREFIYDLLHDFHSNGHTIFFTSHYLDEFEKLCDRIAIIDKGKVLVKGNIPDIRKKYAPSDIIIIKSRNKHPEKTKGLNQYTYEYKDGKFTFKITEAYKSLPHILEKMNRSNIQVKHIEVKKSGLETVFFNLTGTHLRD